MDSFGLRSPKLSWLTPTSSAAVQPDGEASGTVAKRNKEDMGTKALIIIQIALAWVVAISMGGCKTSSVVHEKVVVDSVVSIDTIYMQRSEVRFDTTYVYDSYKEQYVVGKIDTVWNIRVDTVKVETINYIYQGAAAITSDSTANTKVNRQQAATTEVRVVEPEKKKNGAEEAVLTILVAAIFGIVGYYIGRYRAK